MYVFGPLLVSCFTPFCLQTIYIHIGKKKVKLWVIQCVLCVCGLIGGKLGKGKRENRCLFVRILSGGIELFVGVGKGDSL